MSVEVGTTDCASMLQACVRALNVTSRRPPNHVDQLLVHIVRILAYDSKRTAKIKVIKTRGIAEI